jgi:cation diffusion facilitator family transporter
MTQQDRYWQAKKITLIGAIINIILGVIKLVGGLLYHSHALLADGIHSFSDLVTDIMVIFASKYGSQDADASHPYGHKRIETASTLFLALLLILAGTGIAWHSLDELIYARGVSRPDWLALPIALLSVVTNEILFHYTDYVGKRIESSLVVANAWHHRSDGAASIIVTLGLLGSLFGFVYLDGVAAIIIGGMIIKMGLSYGWASVKELVDTAADPALLQQIEHTIKSVDGVKKIHQLRSRSMGSDILIDVHTLVAPFISVSEGHYIAQHVDKALLEQIANVKDVTVHVDPEDDELSCPSIHLPNRASLEQELLLGWQKDFPALQKWTLHYLDGKIIIDLQLKPGIEQWQALSERIKTDLHTYPNIKQVRLFSQHGVIDNEKT